MAILLLLLACTASSAPEALVSPAPAPAPATPATEPAPAPVTPATNAEEITVPWTLGTLDVPRSGDSVALSSVRAGRNEGFDRFVLEFQGDRLPGYHVAYVDRPIVHCGSGDPIDVPGDAWLEVRLSPVDATAGKTTVEPSLLAGMSLVRAVTLTCNFEAQTSWAIGLARPNAYRVLELKDPPRLVVDVQG